MHYNKTQGPPGFTCIQNGTELDGSTRFDCVKFTNGPLVPTQSITNLSQLKLTGTASLGGTDALVLDTAGGVPYTINQSDSILGLAQSWKDAEFNVFGDGCASATNFNANSTIVVRTTTHSGTENAPTCLSDGFTAETNNLILVGTPAVGVGASPGIVFKESNVTPASQSSCDQAAGVGDTHLTTFGHLLYDFQAVGDFQLAETDSHFRVETRQVTWSPNIAVNNSVSVQTAGSGISRSRVTICLASPLTVKVDGKSVTLSDGVSKRLRDGGDVMRRSNEYLVRGPNGDSVLARINSGNGRAYIDVFVGLGRWPTKAYGLLANSEDQKRDPTGVLTGDGIMIPFPFTYDKLYGDYGHLAESWSVPVEQSMLALDCGDDVGFATPGELYFASNLDKKVASQAQEECKKAGVSGKALLDACTLDVALMGKAAANVYGNVPIPVVIGDVPH